jgi:hypothetical protein
MDENDLPSIKGINVPGDPDVPFNLEKENNLFETGLCLQASLPMVIGLVLLIREIKILKVSYWRAA